MGERGSIGGNLDLGRSGTLPTPKRDHQADFPLDNAAAVQYTEAELKLSGQRDSGQSFSGTANVGLVVHRALHFSFHHLELHDTGVLCHSGSCEAPVWCLESETVNQGGHETAL